MIIRALFKTLLLPPTSLLLLMLIAWLGWRRWPRFSRSLLGGALLVFWILSLPVVGGTLLMYLERGYQPFNPEMLKTESAQGAIVVLGGGRVSDAREYGGDTVNSKTLERLRYGARLYRETGWPILLTGGRVFEERDLLPEAQLMAQVMTEEFQIPVTWQEEKSKTTAENAAFSAQIFRQQGIETVLLVTHGWHMPRASRVFQQAGLTVIPAPMALTIVEPDRLLSWFPSLSGLSSSYFALHEFLGGWVYRWQESRKAE
ncbi:YdcF family protein [Aestuariicella sp. G3-2]|uniref:YdcF family protein n=1 Tax=Pseudomaricurvus albidus TaxID=2842452 RepID=UPI001C0CDDC7|nr:YdcF family protein [Aestuariicella albida]MBU3070955.1 YdcF family protein [Aestuariicella albida]